MNEQQLEQEIQSKGLDAPRLTPQHIDEQIVAAYYHRVPDTTVTVCVLTLRNGFNTVGHSACVSPRNFDEAIGKKLAFDNARNKIWELEGYNLRDYLTSNAMETQAKFDAAVDRRDMPSGARVPDDMPLETSEKEARGF